MEKATFLLGCNILVPIGVQRPWGNSLWISVISRKILRKGRIRAWGREPFKRRLKWQLSSRELSKSLPGGQIPFMPASARLDVAKIIFDSYDVFALEQDILSKLEAGMASTSSSLKLHIGVFRCHILTIGGWLWFPKSEVSSVPCWMVCGVKSALLHFWLVLLVGHYGVWFRNLCQHLSVSQLSTWLWAGKPHLTAFLFSSSTWFDGIFFFLGGGVRKLGASWPFLHRRFCSGPSLTSGFHTIVCVWPEGIIFSSYIPLKLTFSHLWPVLYIMIGVIS